MNKIIISFCLLFVIVLSLHTNISVTENYNDFDSSFINEISYEYNSNILIVKMKGERAYKYFNVSRNIFNEFKKAESKGRFFNKYIKNHYGYKRKIKLEQGTNYEQEDENNIVNFSHCFSYQWCFNIYLCKQRKLFN